MRIPGVTTLAVGAVAAIASSAFAYDVGLPGDDQMNKFEVLGSFLESHPGAATYEDDIARVTKVYGKAFSHGNTAQESADAFLNEWMGIWGINPADMIAKGPFQDGHHVQPIMYQKDTGTYKFTGFYYTQTIDGFEVFRSKLALIVRNEATHPLVLASADVRDLSDFSVPNNIVTMNDEAIRNLANKLIPGSEVTDINQVIWAGVDDMVVEPKLATTFVAEAYGPAGPLKYLYVVDAVNGDILYEENQILDFIDVEGSVHGMATNGVRAGECDPETEQGMPYARVSIGGTVAFADVLGDFVIPNGGSSDVTVNAEVRGQWFNVQNQGGADASQSMVVTPGVDTADFIFNEPNNSEITRAEVNAYIESNIVRDFALSHNPTYPTIPNQQDWPVNVNIGSNCNAFYNGSSINFYTSGGGCNNTAFSVVVHHEYGHHMVNVGGSGQGAYGEGMSDCMGVIITGTPQLAIGFNSGNCSTGIRNADNSCLYLQSGCSTCGSAIHSCGQLISGCVWDTFQELIASDPFNAQEIIGNLTVNSILLHNGTSIDPSITIDFLTLDDDNGDIGDGTPHYTEIANGFGAHDMDAPPLALLGFQFPNGVPQLLPESGTTIRVEVVGVAGDPEPGTGMVFVNTGGGFVGNAMTEIQPNVYDAFIPGSDCGSTVFYYFSAETTSGSVQTLPTDAPATSVPIVVGSEIDVVFEDNFQTNKGWTVSGNATDGQWQRGTPAGGGDRGDPPSDGDGSGQCYVTDNADGNSDVDGGTTTLTSPVMDASNGGIVSYMTWYSNVEGDSPMADTMVVEVSDDNGATWLNLETIGPSGPEVSGGWFPKQFNLSDVPGLALTDQFRIRFHASDLGAGSIVEAGVDGFDLSVVTCDEACQGDIDGDGFVSVPDMLAMFAEWGPCPVGGCDSDLDGDGNVNVADLLILFAAWGTCP